MEEISQIAMIEQYLSGAVRLKDICERFKLHRATVWRKIQKLRQSGRAGLAHGLKGRPSNNLTPATVKERLCDLYEREYRPLGVRLWEFHHRVVRRLPDRVSYSTLRRWMMKIE
jgi:transposase